jgi:hypothetical protein
MRPQEQRVYSITLRAVKAESPYAGWVEWTLSDSTSNAQLWHGSAPDAVLAAQMAGRALRHLVRFVYGDGDSRAPQE